jgi:GR25 family glycosyltransferase involved in LPS biosynthesis
MNFKEMFPLTVVINLDKRPDRYKVCVEQEFPKIGITPIRKPGILFSGADNSWSNGAIGCMASHYHVLQSALLLGTNVAIFEDDVHFLDEKYNIMQILESACAELQDIKWDMVYLGANILKPFNKQTEHLAKIFHAQSTVAYLVNKDFAEKLLGYIDMKNITVPIDVIYAEKVVPENNCFITIPMLVTQRNDFSDIEGKNVQYEDYLERRYWSNYRG